MKLLVVGHSYITAFSQSKYAAMKQLHSELQLRLVMPDAVRHVFKTYKPEIHPELEPLEVVPLPTIFNQSHMTHILHPARFAALLKGFDPDHIHIEEDPHSLVGVETVFLARQMCRCATISFFIWDNLLRRPRFPLNVIKRTLTRYSFARCELVVCGNSEAQRLLREDKCYMGHSLVLPQVGLDPDEYTAPLPPKLLEQLGKSDDTPLIGFLGRLVPEKGIGLLLEALSRLQTLKWKLLLVGNGPMKEQIRTNWHNMFGQRLLCLDAIPHKAVSHYLRALDIFVFPSYGIPTWKEQFGLTLAQAMMSGVACIGSSSGAIPDVLGANGLIFKEKDLDGLTCALKKVLESEALRSELGDKARAFALQRYSKSAVASAYLAAFENMASSIKNEARNYSKVG